MSSSRVNLIGLATALIAGLVDFSLPQTLLSSVAGLTLLVALFAYDEDRATRTSIQSLAFGLVCGLALLCTCSYLLGLLLSSIFGSSPSIAHYFPLVFWLLAAGIFWAVDRSRLESGVTQTVTLNTYTPPPVMASAAAPTQAAAPAPQYATRPFTPAPVVFTPPPPPAAPPAQTVPAAPEPIYVAPAPPTPAPVPPPAAPAPPALTGKPVSIYVNMVGEGMNLLRPVRAEHLGRDFYIITDEMPTDESWEYVPGQVVRCKKKNLSNGKGLVAYEEAPRAQ